MKESIDGNEFAKLWSRGFSAQEIADMTGLKLDSVYKRAHRMGLAKRNPGAKGLLDKDPEKRKWFIKNYPEMSNDTMSVFLGIRPDYIGKIARRLGLKKSDAYWDGIKDYHKKRVRQYHESHKKKDNEDLY